MRGAIYHVYPLLNVQFADFFILPANQNENATELSFSSTYSDVNNLRMFEKLVRMSKGILALRLVFMSM
jgi:hypothetical protein